MNEQENTTIVITSPNREPVTIILNQEYIDDGRVDILLKGCERAALSFMRQNNWELRSK